MSKPFKIIMTIIGLIVGWAFISSLGNQSSTSPNTAPPAVTSSQPTAQDPMQQVHDQVAQDSIDQFEIANRGEDRVDACVQAGMVAAAFLQAKNEERYNHWKKVEKDVCASAGITQ